MGFGTWVALGSSSIAPNYSQPALYKRQSCQTVAFDVSPAVLDMFVTSPLGKRSLKHCTLSYLLKLQTRMEHKSIEVSHAKAYYLPMMAITFSESNVIMEKDKDRTRNEATEFTSEVSVEDASKALPSSPINDVQVHTVAWKGGGIDEETLQNVETPGEVNMEVSVTAEDVIQAGGFGARDDISSFLPVASDWTDFEASIRDARDYEEPQGEVHRPGLGWREASERE
ncbi:hypothetical protein QUC31_010629 [Theobroma cacao]